MAYRRPVRRPRWWNTPRPGRNGTRRMTTRLRKRRLSRATLRGSTMAPSPLSRPGPGWHHGAMAIEVRPAVRFEDVATMVGPKRPDANVCWCLSYRLPSKEHLALRGPARGERMRELVAQDPPPGVLAYDGDDVVGWAAVHPRADTSFARNRRKIGRASCRGSGETTALARVGGDKG